MNKMDEYFKNKLTNYKESEEEDWNLPSEQIWEKALPHFPKKKERSVAIYFLLGFAVASLLTISYFALTNDNSTPADSNKIITETKTSVTPTQPSIEPENESNKLDQTKLISPTVTKANTANKVTGNAILSDTKSVEVKMETQSSISFANNNNNNNNNNRTSTSPISAIAQTTAAASTKSKETPATSSSQRDAIGRNTITSLELLPSLSLATIQSIQKEAELSQHTVTPIQPFISPLAQKEVGIGTARYLIHLLPVLEDVIEEDTDSININGQFNSFNLYFRKWLSPKWSIASGAYYTSADLDFYLDVVDTLSCSDLGVFVNQQFGSQLTQRERCDMPSENDDLELYLKDGVTVEESDSLNFVADGQLKVKGFQFPLMLTRHWKKRRVEYTLGIGASLDLFFVDQSEISLDLRRDGASLLKSIYVQAPLKETEIDYGFYLDSGIRVPLYKNLNLGITSRINFRDLFLSGIEAGLFYRW